MNGSEYKGKSTSAYYYGLVDSIVRKAIHAPVGCVRRLPGCSYPYFTTMSTSCDGSLYGGSSNIIFNFSIDPRITGRRKWFLYYRALWQFGDFYCPPTGGWSIPKPWEWSSESGSQRRTWARIGGTYPDTPFWIRDGRVTFIREIGRAVLVT